MTINEITAESRTFAIFANGTYWGTWGGPDAATAMQAAADDVGTDGSTDGMAAHEVTQAQARPGTAPGLRQ